MDIGQSETVLAFEGHFFVTSQNGNYQNYSLLGLAGVILRTNPRKERSDNESMPKRL